MNAFLNPAPRIRPVAVVIDSFQEERLSSKHAHLIISAYRDSECTSMQRDILVIMRTKAQTQGDHKAEDINALRSKISVYSNIPPERIPALADNGDDERWTDSVNALVAEFVQERPVVIYCYKSIPGLESEYKGQFRTHFVDLDHMQLLTGT